jgi:benzoate membrane transport protein
MFKDFSVSSIVAGFVAALVGFTGSVALIFEAARNLSATPDQTASWLWALGIGIGLSSVGLSFALKQPVMIAWSTAGAALVGSAAAGGHLTMPQAIGAFLVSAVLITLSGVTGGFAKIMNRLPMPLAAALLAGVLSKFTLDAFAAVPRNPALLLPMFAAFIAGRNFWPRYNIPVILILGVTIASLQGLLHLESVPLKITLPVWTTPVFAWGPVIGVGIPLFVVTMASQNLPGFAILRAHGYEPPVSKIVGWSGFTNLLLAPFGAYSLNLAAITAAFVLGPDAHPDPKKRYPAAAVAGIFYALIGIFGATLTALFYAFPRELVLALGGLGLLSTIASSLSTSLAEVRYRESSVITFFITLSGMSLLGIGSAFWGMIGGVVVLAVRRGD